MSKIRVFSEHVGRLGTKVKGESVSVVFESKTIEGGKVIGVADLEYDTAAVLLGMPKGFWKNSASDGSESKKAQESSKTAGKAEEKTDDQSKESDVDPTKTGKETEPALPSGGEPGLPQEEIDRIAAEAIHAAAVELNANTNFNSFKANVKKCDDPAVIKATLALEIDKEDPKENRLAVLNGRMTELQG